MNDTLEISESEREGIEKILSQLGRTIGDTDGLESLLEENIMALRAHCGKNSEAINNNFLSIILESLIEVEKTLEDLSQEERSLALVFYMAGASELYLKILHVFEGHFK
ncbi:hypothetical protein HON22_04315 [Candidatus Peregrinibacteria bacterium]|nr:hypothetical protein [Candidatus Peregrinibacteria bacterium]